jgi:hypothetical protein
VWRWWCAYSFVKLAELLPSRLAVRTVSGHVVAVHDKATSLPSRLLLSLLATGNFASESACCHDKAADQSYTGGLADVTWATPTWWRPTGYLPTYTMLGLHQPSTMGDVFRRGSDRQQVV